MFRHRSLKTSLYRVFVSSILVPFILISMIVCLFFYNQLIRNYKENNKIILQSIISHMDSSLKSTDHTFLQYIFSSDISRFYQFVNKNEVDASKEIFHNYIRYSSKYRVAMNNYLTMFNTYVKGIGFLTENERKYNCFYMNKYSNYVISYHLDKTENREILEEIQENPVNKVWFLKDSLMQSCEEYSQPEQIFTMIRGNNHLETATRQGSIFLEVSEKLFSDLLNEISLPEGAGLALYFPDGREAYSTQKQLVFDEAMLKQMKNVFGKTVKMQGEKFYLFSMQEERYGFSICYLLPQSILWKQVVTSTLLIIGIWGFSILVAFIIYIRMSKKISDCTEKIISNISKYRLGNKLERQLFCTDGTIEEFDDITSAFLEMTERIETLIQQEYIVKMNQQMAEYKAMQAEINPHFFNNVMNSLLGLSRSGDKRKLEYAIVNLSRMFRYTCEHDYESTVLQECEFIESYLMLEKLRFEERLHYHCYMEEELKAFPLPKLLFQPIVENAMIHGMNKDGSPLTIFLCIVNVKSKEGKDFIWISIANDGIPYNDIELQGKGRVGIKNVQERLEITYPESFFWYDRNEKFTTVCNILILKR